MERMKRNKNQEWTRVLQERLQDAQLPAPDDYASWSGQKSPAFPATSPKTQGDRPEHSGHSWPVAWWPWALGSVAVAACAGNNIKVVSMLLRNFPGLARILSRLYSHVIS